MTFPAAALLGKGLVQTATLCKHHILTAPPLFSQRYNLLPAAWWLVVTIWAALLTTPGFALIFFGLFLDLQLGP
ncbi:hypothetical protein [Desulfogranum mediterraneum]|uniref:hypothetical protein n=1 Tax=Desulfogranum mediterraneum TaxID=160661 RepID=UPI0038B9AC9D